MTDKPISIIAAVAENGAIGKDNKLLCYLPADLKRFRQITLGHTVLMGKNTYLSLPFRPLKDRRNIIISDVPGEQIPRCLIAWSIEEALEKCESDDENFVIGGASIYQQMMPFANKLYITRIYKSFEADTFFPEIDMKLWKLIEESPVKTDDVSGLRYAFLTFERI
jgi:dihydrofolate reductase